MSLDVLAKAAEERLTLAPIYAPDTTDRHGEWTTAAELERAIFDFVKSGDRAVRWMHQDGTAIGEIESAFIWPWPAEADVFDGRGVLKGKKQFPAGSAFAWVRWSPEAWAAIKRGEIRGLSVGGRAMRVRAVGADDRVKKNASGGWGQRLARGETVRFA